MYKLIIKTIVSKTKLNELKVNGVEEYLKIISKKHGEGVRERMSRNYKKIGKWIHDQNIVINDYRYDFYMILTTEPYQLKELKKSIDSKCHEDDNMWKNKEPKQKNGMTIEEYVRELKSIQNWLVNNDKYYFVKDLDITVCPYRNRSYIAPIEDKIVNKLTSEIDHILPRSEYPLLSLFCIN